MTKNCQPSPAKYGQPPVIGFQNHDLRKQRMPAYSFGMRLQDKQQVSSPAPNAYGVPSIIGGKDVTKENAPKYSMKHKLQTKDHMVSPAPNAYNLQNFKPGQCSPAYSMSARFKELGETVEC